jgi:hypothetical protein
LPIHDAPNTATTPITGSDPASSSTGYMRRFKTVSRQTSVSVYSATNISTIVSTAVETYLRNYFETTGKHRRLLEQFAPSMTYYIADPDFVPASDPTKQALSIQRYSERIAAEPPGLVITDSGVVLKTVGFGRSVAQDQQNPGIVSHHISIFRDVPVTILIVASSRSDLASLCQVIHSIFYDLSNFVSGKLLFPENDTDTWLIRLPMQMDAGNYEKTQQTDDVKMQLWSNTFSFTCTFEDAYMLAGDELRYDVPSGLVGGPVINFPTTIRAGRQVIGSVSNLQSNMQVLLSDHNIANISKGSSPSEYRILAKRPGKFSLQIVQGATTSANPNPGQSSMVQPNVVASQDIIISF